MTEPKIEELRQKADSKFALVMGAAKRTRQIIDFMNALGRGDAMSEDVMPPDMNDIVDRKPVMIALKEIGNDRIKIIYPSGQEVDEEEAGGEAKAVVEGEGAGISVAGKKAKPEPEEVMLEGVVIPEILKTKEDKKKEKAAKKTVAAAAKDVAADLQVGEAKAKKETKAKKVTKEKQVTKEKKATATKTVKTTKAIKKTSK